MTLARLATHLAELPSFPGMMLEQDEADQPWGEGASSDRSTRDGEDR